MQWFCGEVKTREEPMRPVRLHWLCPNCPTGEMIHNGVMWPTSEGGYHHVCNVCGVEWACRGAHYPRIEFMPAVSAGAAK